VVPNGSCVYWAAEDGGPQRKGRWKERSRKKKQCYAGQKVTPILILGFLGAFVAHLERQAGTVLARQLPAAVKVPRRHRAGLVREVYIPDGSAASCGGRGGGGGAEASVFSQEDAKQERDPVAKEKCKGGDLARAYARRARGDSR